MEKSFWSAVEDRRSVYAISKEKIVPEERVLELIRHAVKHAPSAFHSQSSRAVVLFHGESDRLWDLAKEALRPAVPAEAFAATEQKLDAFRSGYGTVLFFEDKSVVEGLQKKFPLYGGRFPVWAQQSSGILQYIVWTSFESEGLGVTLQHYDPLIDEKVKRAWGIPENWELIAEMPFGKPVAPPDEKTFLPVDDRMKVFGL